MTPLLLRRLALTVAPLALMSGVVFMAIFGEHGLVNRHDLRQRRVEVQRQIAETELHNAALRRQVRLLERHALAQRRLAAEELGMAPAGSTLYAYSE